MLQEMNQQGRKMDDNQQDTDSKMNLNQHEIKGEIKGTKDV